MRQICDPYCGKAEDRTDSHKSGKAAVEKLGSNESIKRDQAGVPKEMSTKQRQDCPSLLLLL